MLPGEGNPAPPRYGLASIAGGGLVVIDGDEITDPGTTAARLGGADIGGVQGDPIEVARVDLEHLIPFVADLVRTGVGTSIVITLPRPGLIRMDPIFVIVSDDFTEPTGRPALWNQT